MTSLVGSHKVLAALTWDLAGINRSKQVSMSMFWWVSFGVEEGLGWTRQVLAGPAKSWHVLRGLEGLSGSRRVLAGLDGSS